MVYNFWMGQDAGFDILSGKNSITVRPQHAMTKSNAFYLSVGAFLVTIGSWELYFGFTHAGVCLCTAVMFFLPHRWLRRAPQFELFITLVAVVPLAPVVTTCDIVGPTKTTDFIRSIVCHPAFVVTFWLIMMWGLYRKWQRERKAHA
jgi:hypothetical protein